jgi:vacuolar-type H+-ATPase subunit E/Vma4
MEAQVTFGTVAFWKNLPAMSESKAAELAARQVEEILTAAEAAAEQIKQEAHDEVAGAVTEARQRAAQIEQRARDQAIEFDEDSRREAERVLAEAKRRAKQIREQTKRSVAGRVERADAAADEMVGHAEALSDGLRGLGELLTDQGERILREVRAARRELRARMEAGIEGDADAPARREPPAARPQREPDRRDSSEPPEPRRANGARRGRFVRDGESEDLAPPSWVESS